MMFFETTRGESIPVSRIARVEATSWSATEARRDRNNKEAVRVELVDERVVWIGQYEAVRLLESRAEKVWAALPGTFVVHPSEDGEIWKEPVIGWALDGQYAVYPITLDGVNDSVSKALTVLMPDGSVAKPHECSWDSLDEYAASIMPANTSSEVQA